MVRGLLGCDRLTEGKSETALVALLQQQLGRFDLVGKDITMVTDNETSITKAVGTMARNDQITEALRCIAHTQNLVWY